MPSIKLKTITNSMTTNNWVDLAQYRAQYQPNELAYCFTTDNGEEEQLTYSQLSKKAMAIAAELLRQNVEPGERALLLYSPGLHFITGFFGCLYAGIIAVPAYPPQNQRSQKQRLAAILADADAQIVLTNSDCLDSTSRWLQQLDTTTHIPCIATDLLDDSSHQALSLPSIQPDSLAFLQYTSGSTGAPKGVMVNHQNLLHNHEQIQEAFNQNENTRYVSWLPLFHDLGLIGNALQAFYLGTPYHFLAPTSFLQSPIRWLQAVSKHKATISGGPNFAYDLCVERITEAQKETLDLSHWQIAFSGAEPIRAETLERFSNAFSSCGFKKEAFYPSYGLAEATLFVSGGVAHRPPVIKSVCPQALAQNKVTSTKQNPKLFVGIGQSWGKQQIFIVNPTTYQVCTEDEVGEIWVRGDSVAQGYWNKPADTKAIFHAHLEDGTGPFLRTGDLGFMQDNELFITGRLKDLIILRGRNIYPQDIENNVQACHSALKADGGAAFSTEIEGEEQLVIVQEINRTYVRSLAQEKLDPDDIFTRIRQAVSENHDLAIGGIVLIKPLHLPKTSSGKVRRSTCRENFNTEKFDSLATWTKNGGDTGADLHKKLQNLVKDLHQPTTPINKRNELIQQYLTLQIASSIGVEAAQIPETQPINTLGLESLKTVELANAIEQDLATTISLEQLLSDSSVKQLANTLAKPAPRLLQPASKSDNILTEDNLKPNQPFPLTDIQHAYWLGRLDSLTLGNMSTHTYFEFDLPKLDLSSLTEALNKTIKHHPMLRAIITDKGEQKILEDVPFYNPLYTDLRDKDEDAQTEYLEKLQNELSHQTLHHDQWPLFDIRFTQLNEESFRLHLNIDMLIADGWSMHIFMRDWLSLYRKPLNKLNSTSFTFQQYVTQKQLTTQTEQYLDAKKYWDNRVDTLPLPPKLPFAITPNQLKEPKSQRRAFKLPQKEWLQLQEKCKQSGITQSCLLLAVYAEALALWSESPDFCINVTLFNRHNANSDIKNIIGDFTALNLLEVQHKSNRIFLERARTLQQRLLQDLSHRDYSGVEVLRNMPNSAAQTTPFVVFTSFLGLTPPNEPLMGELADKLHYKISQTSQSCLDFITWENSDGLIIAWDCVENLFEAGLLDSLFEAFTQLLARLVNNNATWKEQGYLCKLPATQRTQRLAVNSTHTKFDEHLMHALFAEQARKTPNNIAVISQEKELTYRQLANTVAYHAWELKHLDTKPNDLIPVIMDKGWEQIVAVLAIQFAGAAYVPIDPCWPTERRNKILKQINANRIVTTRNVCNRITWPSNVTHVLIDNIRDDSNEQITSLPTPTQSKQDLAYVIFTSGSTGEPKGVMMDHQAVVNTLQAINKKFRVTAEDKTLSLSSLSFDLSVYDIFGLLAVGGAVILPDKDKLREPAHWWELVNQHNVSLWNSVPAVMQMAVDYLELSNDLSAQGKTPPLRTVMLSGDWIPMTLPNRIKAIAPTAQLHSLGGATEAAIWSNSYPIKNVDPKWSSIPYGKPLANQSLYILKPDLTHCPTWVPGDLYIGGKGLAQGYWKDKIKTDNAFIVDPESGKRFYKTGDIGRYLDDGNIEFLGRKDSQVKLNGYRIELGEIENALNSHSQVKHALVILEHNSNKNQARRLIAYLVLHTCSIIRKSGYGFNDTEINITEMNDWLQDRLPSYMVPTSYVAIDSIPLSVNGKVDRQRLPAPPQNELEAITPPRTKLEKQLFEIWQKELEIDSFSISDSFFDLGGDSLQAAVICTKLSQTLKITVRVSELFVSQTIEHLAESIENLIQQEEKLPSSLKEVPHGEKIRSQAINSSNVSIEHQPLCKLIEEGIVEPVDAAAIAYFPEWLLENNTQAQVNQFIANNNRPLVQTIWQTTRGRIALVLLPSWGHELYKDKAHTLNLITDAAKLANKIGAKNMSLTGVIPSATNYGQDLVTTGAQLPPFTTGHATTTSAVVIAIQGILSRTARNISHETVGYLGLGSIGLTSLELMLAVLPHPKELILCDLYERKSQLEHIADNLRNKFGFKGAIRITTSQQKVPTEFYRSSLIVGATNVPDVLDIWQLNPGTLLVDDSAPHCFSAQEAFKRLMRQQDILFTEGGMLRYPQPLQRQIYLPEELNTMNVLIGNGDNEMMGCTLSSLLSTAPEFPNTIGLVNSEVAVTHYQELQALGVNAPQLHLNTTPLANEHVDSFCNHHINPHELMA